ncbi:hypothetical protein BDV37DRAFT_244943 [Aspergillus pseudonomiae]|uniref:Uncharacterized protein n=1 Tax=Aspergillus pseudonomiae TaxID=1506151 RepID=A0A5N7DGG7_9EURO|nr:uncharacterized protein BDV37DRAFT_244943 [Aspergillus pseudonomiae]KAE8405384.1 hypothetical protein BDV37DRAFT_244943 [Aspergillus pseudonomiae]
MEKESLKVYDIMNTGTARRIWVMRGVPISYLLLSTILFLEHLRFKRSHDKVLR